jgi:uncharacterized membrane protein (UPF0127 family)
MAKFKKSLIVLIAITGVAILLFSLQSSLRVSSPAGGRSNVLIDGQEVSVTIAQTMEEQRQGLSGTPELRESTGMLFIYNQHTIPQFWMKDMNYPIDIIWIKDNRVVGFVENAPVPIPDQELPRYHPDEPINYVLEVPAGFVARYGTRIGSAFEYGLGN